MERWRSWVAASCLLAGMALSASADGTSRVKLALFRFELDDFSAAATVDESPADAEQLARVTDDVRALLVQSGRYDLVDLSGADAAPLKKHDLRSCNGCDAAIALQFGADQSLVGVVKRISRAEYQVRYELRDARTGAMLSEADTGLRMGALDSWGRGAKRLVKDRLLAQPAQ